MSDRSPHIGVPFAEMWGRESEVWLKEERLRQFEAKADPELKEAIDHGEQGRIDELLKEWDALAAEIKQARLRSLMESPVFAVPKGQNKNPREIAKAILRTMTVFDRQRGTMSDSAGVRQFDCVEFFPSNNKGPCAFSPAAVEEFVKGFMRGHPLARCTKAHVLNVARETAFARLRVPLPMSAIEKVWRKCSEETGAGWHLPGRLKNASD
jgi:hypothetical protein